MRFGQWIGAFLLDWVLRRHHEEGLVEHVGLPADGDAALLHRFEKRRLRLGRGAVDFVSQHDLREDRPLAELKLATFLSLEAMEYKVVYLDKTVNYEDLSLDAGLKYYFDSAFLKNNFIL